MSLNEVKWVYVNSNEPEWVQILIKLLPVTLASVWHDLRYKFWCSVKNGVKFLGHEQCRSFIDTLSFRPNEGFHKVT